MIFTTYGSLTGNTRTQLFIEAPSWIDCVNYLENNGEIIKNISNQPISSIIPVVNVTGTTNCYQVILTSENGLVYNYYVWESDLNSLYTWINSQGNVTVTSILNQQITYVLVE